MSTLTVFGVSGGVGATTLVAYAYAALTAVGRSSVPALAAHDPQALMRRLHAEPVASNSSVLLRDGGRASLEVCRAALEEGVVGLVGAATPLGDAMLGELLEAIWTDQFAHRIVVVRTALYGRPSRHSSPTLDKQLVPFDHVLARPGRIASELQELRAPTRNALDRWSNLTTELLLQPVQT